MSTPAPKSEQSILAKSINDLLVVKSATGVSAVEIADVVMATQPTVEAFKTQYIAEIERENAALREANIKALTSARNIARRAANVCSCDARRMGFVNEAKELDAAIEAARKQEGK